MHIPHIYTHIHIYIYIYIHIYTHILHIYYTYTQYTHIHIYIYIYIYTYIHTNTIYTLLYTWPEVHRNVRKNIKPLKYFPTEMRRREVGWWRRCLFQRVLGGLGRFWGQLDLLRRVSGSAGRVFCGRCTGTGEVSGST